MTAKRPTRPPNLGLAGRALWKRVMDEGYIFRPDELRVLEDACRESDLIDRLECELTKPGVTLQVRGSKGQMRAHPLLAEIRAHRVTLDRLLTSLKLKDAEDDNSGQGALFEDRSSQMRNLAQQRWRR
jgi:hypothetical protein